MTPDQLRYIGTALYGEQWQSPLARAIGCDARTVRRWIAEKLPIGRRAEAEIRRIAALRNIVLPGAIELSAEEMHTISRALASLDERDLDTKLSPLYGGDAVISAA